jgi:hypothetical protein
MMPEIGEVREFATGFIVSVSPLGGPGFSEARMQTVQKIWTGERCAAAHEWGVSEVLVKMAETRA